MSYGEEKRYLQVAVCLPVNGTFTYSVSGALADRAEACAAPSGTSPRLALPDQRALTPAKSSDLAQEALESPRLAIPLRIYNRAVLAIGGQARKPAVE